MYCRKKVQENKINKKKPRFITAYSHVISSFIVTISIHLISAINLRVHKYKTVDNYFAGDSSSLLILVIHSSIYPLINIRRLQSLFKSYKINWQLYKNKKERILYSPFDNSK